MRDRANNSTISSLLIVVALVTFSFSQARAAQTNIIGPAGTPTLGNYPATAVDLSDNITVTPDAAPTGATSITVSTSTSFNAELTADVATGVVRLTNAQPAKLPPGAYTVTVRAFGPGGSTTRTFMLTVTTPPACAGITFAAASNFTVGTGPFSVAVGDFNGDGVQDLAAANYFSNNVSVLIGTGTGSFGAASNFTVGTNPDSVAVGDFNGDGVQDLAAANAGSNNVSVLIGTGTGSFGAASNFTVGAGPLSVAVGDFNGDGVQDLAAANAGSNNVSVFIGTGTGSFGGNENFTVGTQPASVAVGDFNGDGVQDLAATNVSTNNVSVLIGTGTGSFGPPSNFPVGVPAFSVAVGDFNGDGVQDLATANLNSSNVSVLIGYGNGQLWSPSNFPLTVGESPCLSCRAIWATASRISAALMSVQSSIHGNVSVLLRTCGGGTLGNYPATVVDLSDNITVTPDAVPTGAHRVLVFDRRALTPS